MELCEDPPFLKDEQPPADDQGINKAIPVPSGVQANHCSLAEADITREK